MTTLSQSRGKKLYCMYDKLVTSRDNPFSFQNSFVLTNVALCTAPSLNFQVSPLTIVHVSQLAYHYFFFLLQVLLKCVCLSVCLHKVHSGTAIGLQPILKGMNLSKQTVPNQEQHLSGYSEIRTAQDFKPYHNLSVLHLKTSPQCT